MPPKVRRREPRKRGLYYHSTPPKVIPANETKHVERRFRNKTQSNNNDVFVVKPSNIRIWIHDKDIAKLTRVLWSGQGFRLLNETSTHGKVRKFLENVPLVLNTVKEIHAAVIENNTEQLQFLLELPPPAIITTKDQNGLTVAHKAAGLGHPEMLDFIVKTWPQGSKEIDKTGKTPLHWSALAKDTQSSIQEMLMQNFGVQEDVMDYKMKTPAYYKTKPQELEKSFLTALPTAPRIQRHQVVDWALLEDDIGDLNGSRPMDKIVVEKKKKSIERDEEGIDPDLEESAKKSKNNLDETKMQSDFEIENVTAPISKILQNGKIPNGKILSNDNNNNSEYITTTTTITPNENENTINSIENGDLVNGNLIMNGDDDDQENKSISLEPSPSPLSLSDTPDQTYDNTPMTIKQVHTPDIQEIKTPSLQMVQSDESLKDNLETNSTNNEQDEENLTTNNSNELQNLIEDSDEKLNDEKLDNNNDDDQNEIETDKLENDDIINSDNNSDIVNNINDNLNNESTNEEELIQENDDDNNEPDNEANNDEPDNEVNEPDNEVNEPNNEIIQPDNETNESENKTEEEQNETASETIENDEIEDNDETKEPEDNNELNNENPEENNESNENETKVEENENEDQDEKPTEDTETIENNEEAKINLDEPETEEIENNEETKLDDDNVEKIIENDSNQEENNNDEKIENESEIVETETENDSKQDETNNDEKELENLETETISIKTTTSSENKQDENSINNNENELNSNNKPDDGEESDDETSLNDSMDQTDYDVGSTDGTHNTSFRSPSSPSMSHDIEGFVHGEPDDNQVQSQSTEVDLDEETKINEIIKSGDMEQLAAIVLNGQGNKLLGAQSSQPEIQAFLDNVPSYMSKINRVHQAAKDGNLRDLQAALDRRKFAIARNEMSPKGATPLHVSTIFGHSGIVRYLAGRFPETTTTVDEDGRTPLHYAATINDNAHFYNLLVHFGSNPKATDKLGNTPEYYKDHKSTAHILSHKQLLKSFGANETLETEMFSDQVPDDVHSARKYLDDEDVITTLERCFKLINESTLTPNTTNNNNNNNGNASASSLRLNITTYLARFLKRSVFDKIKYRQTKLDHNLFDIIWPAMKKSSKEKRIDEDLNSGVVAPDYDVFVVFQEFFIPLIKDMHCLNLSQELKPHPRLFYFPLIDGEKDEFINYDIDDSNKYVSELYVECTRNLDEFELPLNLNIGQIEHAERLLIERILTTEFAKAIGEPEAGIYYTMNEVLESPSEIRHVLENSKLMIPLLDSREPEQEAECHAINGMFWPYGRGVFISHQGDLAAWINVQDHLRIIVGAPNSQPTNIGYAYSKVGRAITFLEGNLHFRESYFLGYLSSRPSFLGAALKVSAILELPNLMKEIDNLRHLCVVRGLHMIPELDSNNNMNTIGKNNKKSQQVDIPLFKTEQGQYLAASKWLESLIKHKPKKPSKNLTSDLGDPLVKALTEIADKRPDDPIEFLINYLQDYVQIRNQNGGKKPINGLTNHINGVVTQPGSGSQSSAIPAKPNPPSVNNSIMSRQESENKLDAENDGTDDDNLSDSTVVTEDRDEHGQSMLHFACARSHGRNALISLIDESNIDITYRDELYRTARDVSLQANQPGNAKEIDRYVLSLAANGDDKPFQHMLLNGYDHILDVEDEDGNNIFDICRTRASSEISRFLDKVRSFEESREQIHAAIRLGQLDNVEELTIVAIGSQLVKAKNYYGRTALHIAVLKESEEIVEYIATNFPETIKIGDNLERTPLHYAMGVTRVENVSRILINKGAKRTAKDLKGRQPSYYFINKSDILRLQEEETEDR